MAYTVLARRYRSGTFDEVIGQDHVAQTLKRAIQAGRVAHAYLFTGTRGVGKTSMARILAKALNCLAFDAPTTTPCGQCSSCTAIAKGEDIDVIEIDAASSTGVDNIRDLIANAAFRPARSRFKVYIIDEVHMLSKGAFNALLKIMEEPPEHVKFILATTEVDKILPTILSRCQRYDFRNIPTREIVEHLRMIAKEERVDAEDEALQLVARAGAGSMRDALSLLDRLLSVGERKLTSDMIEQLLGMPKAAAIFNVADAIGRGDVKGTLERANSVVTGGLSTDTLIATLIDHFHNLLVLATCGVDSNLVDVVGVDLAELDAQAKSFDATALTTNITILEELRRQMRSSQTGRAMLDATLARLAMAGQFSTIGELVARMNGTAPPTRAGASPPRSPTSTTPPPAPRPTPVAEKKTPELNADRATRSSAPSPLTPAAVRSDPSVAKPPAAAQENALDVHASERSGRAAVALSGVGSRAVDDATSVSASAPPANVDDAPDELPAVGKVAADGAMRSMWQAFKKSAPVGVKAAVAVAGREEPSHLASIRAQAVTRLPPNRAAMFATARFVAWDQDAGAATLWFPHDAATAADYVRKHRGEFEAAFADQLGRSVAFTLDLEPEPAAAAVPTDARPKVVRPNLDAVAAETPDEAPRPTVDIDAVKDDPIVAALLKAFEGARIVKVD